MDGLTYRRARWIVVGVGAVVVLAASTTVFLLGSDIIEVVATLLLLPLMVAVAFTGAGGGAVAGMATGGVYLALRLATLGGLPAGEFAGSIIGRLALYLAIGAMGGAANRSLERSLHKLELYDEVDDATGVGNVRAIVNTIDRERARATRYGTVFSIGVLEVDRGVFDATTERRALRSWSNLLHAIDEHARANDAVGRIPETDRERVVVVMPETGAEGARVFSERLLNQARADLIAAGLPAENGHVRMEAMTVPGDDERVEGVMRDLRELLGEIALPEAA